MDPNNPQRAPFKPGGGLNPPFQQGSVPLQQPNVPFQQGGGANTPFQQNGGLNAPFQPPNANGYIQPRPRQAPTVPPNAASPAAPAPNAVPILSPTSPPVASIPPQMVQQTVGAPPAYIMGGYQPRSLTMPE